MQLQRSKGFAITLTILLTFLFIFPGINSVGAEEFRNNKFGIHLAQPQDEDLDRAQELVNSNGGEWGYITLVIQENDRSLDKWRPIFDKLRERRLIPIIRIATAPEGENWKRPKIDDAKVWSDFLNSLPWVVKNRYIILFNEPNHATEWGGKVDPHDFAKVIKAYAIKLKETNKDFYLMMAGMDASAPQNGQRYMDEEYFVREVIAEIGVDDFNRLFDGLSSHSYPNPGFSGSIYGRGRGTIQTYDWELALLRSLGVKELPVFITETGWNGDAIPRIQIGDNFRFAFENVWLPDDRVVAVTPFVLNYQGEPFLKFSWVRPGNGDVFPEYGVVQKMEKVFGRPEIYQGGKFDISDLPTQIVEQSTYHLRVNLKNEGQAIWSRDGGYDFALEDIEPSQYLIASFGEIKPGEEGIVNIYFSTFKKLGEFKTKLSLYRDTEKVLSSELWSFEVTTLPSLIFTGSLFPKFKTNTDEFELQIFNKHEELVFRKRGLSMRDGAGSIEKVENISLGQKYRIVLLKKHYLPRQTTAQFKKGENIVKFEQMLPLDFDGDGALRWSDLVALFKNVKLIRLWWF